MKQSAHISKEEYHITGEEGHVKDSPQVMWGDVQKKHSDLKNIIYGIMVLTFKCSVDWLEIV